MDASGNLIETAPDSSEDEQEQETAGAPSDDEQPDEHEVITISDDEEEEDKEDPEATNSDLRKQLGESKADYDALISMGRAQQRLNTRKYRTLAEAHDDMSVELKKAKSDAFKYFITAENGLDLAERSIVDLQQRLAAGGQQVVDLQQQLAEAKSVYTRDMTAMQTQADIFKLDAASAEYQLAKNHSEAQEIQDEVTRMLEGAGALSGAAISAGMNTQVARKAPKNVGIPKNHKPPRTSKRIAAIKKAASTLKAMGNEINTQ